MHFEFGFLLFVICVFEERQVEGWGVLKEILEVGKEVVRVIGTVLNE